MPSTSSSPPKATPSLDTSTTSALVLAPGVEASSVRIGRPAAGALSRQRTLGTMELNDSQESHRDVEDYICAFGWSAASEVVAIKRSGGRVTYMLLVEFEDDSSDEWALFKHQVQGGLLARTLVFV